MQKPSLTKEQKQAFESAFKSIVSQASKGVQDLWVAKGELKWLDSEVKILPSYFVNKLTGKLADEYAKLERKRNNRTI